MSTPQPLTPEQLKEALQKPSSSENMAILLDRPEDPDYEEKYSKDPNNIFSSRKTII